MEIFHFFLFVIQSFRNLKTVCEIELGIKFSYKFYLFIFLVHDLAFFIKKISFFPLHCTEAYSARPRPSWAERLQVRLKKIEVGEFS